MTLESVQSCPVCKSTHFNPFLTAQDYTVSQKNFTIKKCCQCGLGITSPRPSAATIDSFYQSENYISHSGGSKTLLDRAYLLARNFTLAWKYRLVSQLYTTPARILDYGCGTGDFIFYLKTRGWNTIGVEPSEIARNKGLQKQLDVRPKLELVSEKFEIITLWHVLEHVHEIHEVVEQLKSLLTGNGYLLIAVPNHLSFDAVHYQSYWAGYDVPRHLWHFSKFTMEQFLSEHQLKLEKVIPMKLDAYYVSLLSEQYKKPAANRMVAFIKGLFIGLKSNLHASHTGEYSSLIYVISLK